MLLRQIFLPSRLTYLLSFVAYLFFLFLLCMHHVGWLLFLCSSIFGTFGTFGIFAMQVPAAATSFRSLLASSSRTAPLRVCAPMVTHSELAFRQLTRNHGVNLCYTPMIHARHFVESESFRRSNCDFDSAIEGMQHSRPTIAQIAANEPSTAAAAAQILEAAGVDAVDLNLGCPQNIAKKGGYGAFLGAQIDRVEPILRAMVAAVDIPITAKVRVQPDLDTTLHFCRRIAATGISLLTVHGRTVTENKTAVKQANWRVIKAVVDSVDLPVIANGGVEYSSDVQRLLLETGAAGVMSSESLLENPALFAPGAADDNTMAPREVILRQLLLAKEYVAIARLHEPLSFGGSGGCNSVKSHVFKMLYRILDNSNFHPLRNKLGDHHETRGCDEITRVIEEVERQVCETSDRDLFTEDFFHLSWYRRHRRLHLIHAHPAHKALGASAEQHAEMTIVERKEAIRRRLEDRAERRSGRKKLVTAMQ